MFMSVVYLLYKQKSLHEVQTGAESLGTAVYGCNLGLSVWVILYVIVSKV